MARTGERLIKNNFCIILSRICEQNFLVCKWNFICLKKTEKSEKKTEQIKNIKNEN